MTQLETDIETGLETDIGPLLKVGRALRSIRDQQLYKKNHRSFEKYVSERWKMKRVRAYQYIAAADIIEDLSESFEQKELPKSESAMRPLATLTRIQRIAVWKAALEHSKRPGRGIVEQAIKEVIG